MFSRRIFLSKRSFKFIEPEFCEGLIFLTWTPNLEFQASKYHELGARNNFGKYEFFSKKKWIIQKLLELIFFETYRKVT